MLILHWGKPLKNKQKQLKIKEKKKVKAIRNQGQIKTTESNKDVDNESRKIFDEVSSHERMSEIKDLSRQIDLNYLTYYFKSKSISLINFIGFKAPLHFYRDRLNGNVKLAEVEKEQKQFKTELNEITRGSLKKKSEDQIKTIENIKNLYKLRETVIKL